MDAPTPLFPARPGAALARFKATCNQAALAVGLRDRAFLADLQAVLAYVAGLEAAARQALPTTAPPTPCNTPTALTPSRAKTPGAGPKRKLTR